MPSQASLDLIQQVYVAYYGRPGDQEGLVYWAEMFESTGSLADIFAHFSSQPEFTAVYGDTSSNSALVDSLYQQMFGRAPGSNDGRSYWVNELNEGNITFANLALALVNGAQGSDATILTNKFAAANAITATVNANNKVYGAAEQAAARALLDTVTADASQTSAAILLANSWAQAETPVDPDVEGNVIRLTTGQDIVQGTDGNDTFVAYIVDNQNTLQSGDILDGGAGRDRLLAEIGNSQKFAITAKTKNIEEVYIRTQSTATDSKHNNTPVAENNAVQIDAQDMIGVKQWWSIDSRADLIIEDIRLGASEISDFDALLGEGAATNSLPKDVTFGMRSTDASVDFRAFFDSQSLIAAPDVAANSQLRINLMDLGTETIPFNAAQPLGQLNIEGFNFILNGKQYTLVSDAIYNAKTYAQLEDAVATALLAALPANPELAGITVTRVVNGFEAPAYAAGGGQVAVNGDSILLNDANGGTFAGAGFVAREDGVTDFTLFGRQRAEDPTLASNLIETNIALDNVGRGSQGGDIQVGGMSGTRGIEVFNVTVDRNSRIAEMSSTNKDLKVVNIESTGANGNLSINKLDNVQDVNAGSFKGNLSITGTITDHVIGRDLNLVDRQANPSADNANFDYTFGAGNDSLNLTIDGKVASHEDFVLNINMGNGNNTVTTQFNFSGNQYLNQSDLNNITITTGAGNDTIRTIGEGDVTINSGAGDDTIYLDNSGELGSLNNGRAVWAFNAQDVTFTDLLGGDGTLNSAGNPSSTNPVFLWNAQLTVTFSGATAAGAGLTEDEAVAFANGWESRVNVPTGPNFVADERHINQAIKEAINTDPVLNKLLVAQDGPNNTLVVRSLIDGTYAADDLRIDLSAGTYNTLTGTAKTNVDNAYKLFAGSSLAQLDQTILDNAVTALADGGTYEGLSVGGEPNRSVLATDAAATPLTGSDSGAESDNIVNAGSGFDVIVLGTGSDSNDTVVFTGNFGTNTIVNFVQVAAEGRDYLDFTSYLTTLAYNGNSASAASQARVETSYSADTTLSANEVLIVDFTTSATQTFEGLTAQLLLNSLNDASVSYGGIVNATAVADNAAANFGNPTNGAANNNLIVGTSQDHLILVQNDRNAGEYKVFKLTSVSDEPASVTTGNFATAELVGIVDLGTSLDTSVVTLMDNILV